MSEGGGDDRGPRPDPFAPLPIQPLPPVRRKEPAWGDSAPTASLAPAATTAGEITPPVAADVAPATEDPAEAPDIPAPDIPAPDLLAPVATDDALRAAVGAPPRPPRGKRPPTDRSGDDADDRDAGTPSRRRAPMLIAIAALLAGAGIAAFALLGRVNSARYHVRCLADRIVVERGRSFPPWGAEPLGGAEWKPIEIPPEAACRPRVTEELGELARWYREALLGQASALLTAREVTKVDDAEAQLTQALLVSRVLTSDDDRVNTRKDIDRLQGDVVYGRASDRRRTASEALIDAARQFDAAAAARPRHASDAGAWATHVRRLADELRVGPGGVAPGTLPALDGDPGRPNAPPGVALPIDAVPGGGSAAPAEAPAPDAGVPAGGVLL